jgi:hypothetical protein
MATINPDTEAVVEDKLKANEQHPASLQPARVRERNIVSVKAKKDQPQFTYNRVYVSMRHGKCLEFNLGNDTSLLTRDERFQEFMVRPYAVIPRDRKEEDRAYQLISPKWTGFRAGWLESQTETYNIFRVDRYAAWSGLVLGDHLELEE